MSTGDSIEKNAKEWSTRSWIANKDKLKNSVSITGALLKHENSEYVHFAPAPTEWSVVFEIKKSDIIEVFPTGTIEEKNGQKYTIVELYINKNSILLIMETRLASDVQEYLDYLNSLTEEAEEEIPIARDKSGKVKQPKTKPSPGPSRGPSPTPTRRPRIPVRPAPQRSGTGG